MAVVGGGTAGWLAALVLRRADADVRISVLEAPDIPTVGVGEGSTAIFRQVLLELGIAEADFLRETGATFKFGIHHIGWRGDGGSYFGPIDDPNSLVPTPSGLPFNWLHHARMGAGKPVADAHLFTKLMRKGKAPYAQCSGEMIAVSPFHHAYHFDQARLGRFLASCAVGIDYVRAEVAGLARDGESGDITHLKLKDAADLAVDLVVDCTGFRRAIIGQLAPGWTSFGAFLPLNKAMPFWLDHGAEEIAPYTKAQALGAGWMWSIPTQDRIGCGYVFSDAHTTPEQAQREVEAVLGHKVEPRGVLSIDPGRLNSAWVHNCVAIGLAQSFLEPLEATSIHGSLVQVTLLTKFGLDQVMSRATALQASYNATVARQVDDFAQFINLHYAGGRQDTDFWQDMASEGLTEVTQARLKHWQGNPILPTDFATFPHQLPHVEEQLYAPVLDGLSLLPRQPSKSVFAADAKQRGVARKTLETLSSEFTAAANTAVGHRAYLESTAKCGAIAF